MNNYDDVFIPASRIARTANFRDSKGHRIGIQPDLIEDPDEFDFSIVADMDPHEDLGPINSLGGILIGRGAISKAEIEGSDNLAQEDRVDTDASPGRGTVLQDRYQHEKAVGVSNASLTVAQLQGQLRDLGETVEYCLLQAQMASDKGNKEAARVLDAKAQKYANHMEALEQRIKLKEDHETRRR